MLNVITKEEAAPRFRYVMTCTLDDPDALPPKGEFFCKDRNSWMPEVQGKLQFSLRIYCRRKIYRLLGVFHKQEIKE